MHMHACDTTAASSRETLVLTPRIVLAICIHTVVHDVLQLATDRRSGSGGRAVALQCAHPACARTHMHACACAGAYSVLLFRHSLRATRRQACLYVYIERAMLNDCRGRTCLPAAADARPLTSDGD